MMEPLQLIPTHPGQFDVRQPDGRVLFSYVVEPATPANESPRPYVHPLYSVDGDILSNLRPNDHSWHHGLSLTLTSVNGVNFWGGPSYRAGDGYAWREDHGVQVHVEWRRQTPEHLEHVIEWRDPRKQIVLLRETRSLWTLLQPEGWSLTWTSVLRNVTSGPLRCDNYHSGGGLDGSHYTGLQFRGARGLLDDHGDESIKVVAEGGARGAEAIHGQPSRWIEWHVQHDTSLRRTRLRFESDQPLFWFLRRPLPLVSYSFQRDEPFVIEPDASLTLFHRLTLSRM